MRIAVVLGNRINDDGSFTSIMVRRLELALELYNNEMVDKIICSGGYANPSVNCSEAEKMKEYLVRSSDDVFERFSVGLCIDETSPNIMYDELRLMPKQVSGGVVLKPTKFTLKGE